MIPAARRLPVRALCAVLAAFPLHGLAAPPAEAVPSLARVEVSVTEATNEFREDNRRRALTVHPALVKSAERFAGYMARTGKYGHDADGRTPGQRLNTGVAVARSPRTGYYYAVQLFARPC